MTTTTNCTSYTNITKIKTIASHRPTKRVADRHAQQLCKMCIDLRAVRERRIGYSIHQSSANSTTMQSQHKQQKTRTRVVRTAVSAQRKADGRRQRNERTRLFQSAIGRCNRHKATRNGQFPCLLLLWGRHYIHTSRGAINEQRECARRRDDERRLALHDERSQPRLLHVRVGRSGSAGSYDKRDALEMFTSFILFCFCFCSCIR